MGFNLQLILPVSYQLLNANIGNSMSFPKSQRSYFACCNLTFFYCIRLLAPHGRIRWSFVVLR